MDGQGRSCIVGPLALLCGFLFIGCMILGLVQTAPQQGGNWQEQKMEATEDAYAVQSVKEASDRGFVAVERTTAMHEASDTLRGVVPWIAGAVIAVCVLGFKWLSRPVPNQPNQ